MFIRYEKLLCEELLAHAWSDAAHGIDSIIDVYGLGNPPRYPAIDSISYNVKTEAYGRLVHTLATIYQPAPALRRVSAFDLEFTPNIDSLQGDARDPLASE